MNALTQRAWHDGAVRSPADSIQLCFRDPDMEVLSRGARTWYVSGARFNPDEMWRYRIDQPGVEESLCRQWKDVIIVRTELGPDGNIAEVKCWKGLTAGYDLYYGQDAHGHLVLADNFGDICRALPQNKRVLSENGALDHLLFRAVPTEETHLESVRRVGFGCSLAFRADGFVHQYRRFDRVSAALGSQPRDRYIDAIEAALAHSMAGLSTTERTATLFTGGIDSTLVQSFSEGASTPINVEPECLSESWQFQLDYARQAAELTGKELVGVPVSLKDTRDQILSAIRLAGLPQRDFHTLLWPSAFRADYDLYLTGERADALFGSKGAREAKAAYWLLCTVPGLFNGDAPPGALKGGAQVQLWKAGNRLAKHAGDPFGFASIRSCGDYTNLPWLEKVFGTERVRARIENRFKSYLRQIDPGAIPRHPFYRRLFLAHWTTFWSTEELARMRQIAHALGKTVYAPFAAGPVVDVSCAIPAADKYVRAFLTKHLLKALLHKRVPGYPTSQRKGVTGLDFGKLYRSGDLGNIWEDYDVPDFVPAEWKDTALKASTKPSAPLPELCWPIANLSIWKKEVLDPMADSRS